MSGSGRKIKFKSKTESIPEPLLPQEKSVAGSKVRQMESTVTRSDVLKHRAGRTVRAV